MRTLTTAVLAVFLGLVAPTAASAQCLLCGVIGFMIGTGSSDSVAAGANPNVIYVLPNIASRLPVEERLAVKFAASNEYNFNFSEEQRKALERQTNRYQADFLAGKHLTLADIFKAAVAGAEHYEVLEAMRLISPEHRNRARFWFAYIEKEKLGPPVVPPAAPPTK